jgi:hypothetical protein
MLIQGFNARFGTTGKSIIRRVEAHQKHSIRYIMDVTKIHERREMRHRMPIPISVISLYDNMLSILSTTLHLLKLTHLKSVLPSLLD